jgi:glycosyltransferase involved in cell wall biosynthesis
MSKLESKTVWIINHYAQSPDSAGGTRHFQLAQALPQFGWSACILAASTELNTGRQRLDYAESHRLDLFNGVRFLWFRSPCYRGNGFGRIRNMLIFAVRLLNPVPLQLLPNPDLIIGSSVHPFAVWSAYRLAKHYRVPFVFEVRDLWPQTLIDFGLLRPFGIPARLLRRLEAFLYRRSSAIITLLPFAHRYIQRFGVEHGRIHWIPNGVDLSKWPVQELSPHRSRDELQLMYFGAFGQANSLETLLQAMHALAMRSESPRVRLRLIGDGPMKPMLASMAFELGLSNVVFESPVPKHNIPNLAVEADCFVAVLKDSPLYQYGISLNKLFDYMAAGRPVIFACGSVNNPVRDAGAGLSVRPGDPSALADAIVSMARLHPEDRMRMARAGRCYVERTNDSRALANKLAKVMDSCFEVSCGK